MYVSMHVCFYILYEFMYEFTYEVMYVCTVFIHVQMYKCPPSPVRLLLLRSRSVSEIRSPILDGMFPSSSENSVQNVAMYLLELLYNFMFLRVHVLVRKFYEKNESGR